MNRKLLIKILCCAAVFSLYLFNLIQKQNYLSQLSMKIPSLAKDVKEIEEDNVKLRYEIACFESPDHLFQLAKQQEFSHLRYPLVHEVLQLEQGVAVKFESPHNLKGPVHKSQPVLATKH